MRLSLGIAEWLHMIGRLGMSPHGTGKKKVVLTVGPVLTVGSIWVSYILRTLQVLCSQLSLAICHFSGALYTSG